MMFKRSIALLLFLMVLSYCESKGGRGGGSSRGSSSRGSSSRGSGSSWGSSWFGSSKSKSSSPSHSSPSYSSPSYSAPAYNSPSGSPSYGWNVNSNSPSYSSGSSFSNNAKPSYGWNAGNKPVGPPPAYPGLANRPVSNSNSPPAYSPSYSNPPAYSPSYSNNYNRHNSYNTHSSYPGYYNQPAYGSTFGSNGLAGNTYIHNNYYGSSRSGGGSPFLTNALFYGAGMHHGHSWGSSSSRRSWDSDEDRRWRSTTKAPYFENKVPGSESYLPAAAVVGAATAFGLASLLPLNVPAYKPLMYCNNTEIAQANIMLDDNVYSCVNNSISVSCPRTMENSTIVDECLSSNKTMECDIKVVEGVALEDLYCTNATLLSIFEIICNSTIALNGTAEMNETSTMLNCYFGQLPKKLASFVPTTTTETPITTTTEKRLSFGAKMHLFLLDIIGEGDVLERHVTTTAAPIEDPRMALKENETPWIPEALTIPPEPTTTTTTTTTTTEAPFDWYQEIPIFLDNGTQSFYLISVTPEMAKLYQSFNSNKYDTSLFKLRKVPRTSTESLNTEATTLETTVVEGLNVIGTTETVSTDISTVSPSASSTEQDYQLPEKNYFSDLFNL